VLDVVVIGAGAAGLLAARELRSSGRRVAVVDARDRVGGRIHTHVDARVPLPIELGAEFIHGAAPETRRLLREASLLAWDVAGETWRVRGRQLGRSESWREVDAVLRRIDTKRPDESLSDFLAREPGGRRLAKGRAAARRFVQGFHAADPDVVGVHSLAPDDEPPSAAIARSGRVEGGYGRLVEWLARESRADLHLRTVVHEIAWKRGRVEVRASEAGRRRVKRFTARAALVTLPIGVLQVPLGAPGHVAIRPDPAPIREALGRLAMGSALRVSLAFREFPWERARSARLRAAPERLSFLRTDRAPFDVWWTAHPAEWPYAVAWCGGPPARALRETGEPADIAAGVLARALGTTKRRVLALVEGTWTHDWDADPFARGAYSYMGVGGTTAASALARPVAATLFFAGEATVETDPATVEGALASGRRAARQIDRALGSR
jgi:monoamine oxidase